eukprot:Sspe_Gene.53598::Locus_29611_Transcript_2_4_Confidence_0.500_Length_1380::g.53598::m.53598
MLSGMLGVVVAAGLVFAGVDATVGVDVSTAVSESEWRCLRGSGGQGAVEFAIVRAYRSSGTVDPNAAGTIKAAREAGVKYVDAYLFPCPKCSKSGAMQVEEAVSHLRTYSAQIGMLWLDIEGTQYWHSSKADNFNFFVEMANKGRSMGVSMGVYCNWNSWSEIMGGYNGSAHIKPLWYPHYDGRKTFSDFRPFGGWHTPSIKQYLGTSSSCGVGVDYNWY